MGVTAVNALTIPYRIVGHRKETVYDVTLDESYAEGGESLTAANLGLNYVEPGVVCQITNGPEAEKWVGEANYTATTEKLHLQDVKTGKELAKETDTSKVVVRVTARGH